MTDRIARRQAESGQAKCSYQLVDYPPAFGWPAIHTVHAILASLCPITSIQSLDCGAAVITQNQASQGRGRGSCKKQRASGRRHAICSLIRPHPSTGTSMRERARA